MARSLPVIRSLPILARGHVYPDGAAYLEVALQGAGVDVMFTRDQVVELKEKIAAFERFLSFEDGRPIDRLRPHREAL